jgi:5'-3' exonuclease
MSLRIPQLTFSGLGRMWRKKEYGRIYQGTKAKKLKQQIAAREKMIDEIQKMEADVSNGMAYSSAICLEEDEEEKQDDCEESASKRAKTSNNLCTLV